MRKAPDIWRRWSVSSGNGLHTLQLRIALRACELLRVGGRLVYSTCTFNPVEDEAVVAEVRQGVCGGSGRKERAQEADVGRGLAGVAAGGPCRRRRVAQPVRRPCGLAAVHRCSVPSPDFAPHQGRL